MRQQIRDELSKIDQEYKWVTIKSESPDEFQLSHPDERPDPEQEATENRPIVTRSRSSRGEDHWISSEGQTRESRMRRLFLPYLTGCKI